MPVLALLRRSGCLVCSKWHLTLNPYRDGAGENKNGLTVFDASIIICTKTIHTTVYVPLRSSLWKHMTDVAGRMLETARSSLRAVADRADDLFDNPDARRALLIKLASASQVFDMSPQHRHERHDSG